MCKIPLSTDGPYLISGNCHLQVTIGTDAEGESVRWEWATNSAHPASFVLCRSVRTPRPNSKMVSRAMVIVPAARPGAAASRSGS